ncbi:unnamed protein product, partial [Sphagnum tenellum]
LRLLPSHARCVCRYARQYVCADRCPRQRQLQASSPARPARSRRGTSPRFQLPEELRFNRPSNRSNFKLSNLSNFNRQPAPPRTPSQRPASRPIAASSSSTAAHT